MPKNLTSTISSKQKLWLTRFLLAALLAGWGALGLAASSTAVTLGSMTSFDVNTPIDSWIESGDTLSVEQVVGLESKFRETPSLHREELSEASTLWMRLRFIRRDADVPKNWVLMIPLPYVDDIKLFSSNAEGTWLFQSAGDVRPQSDWNRPGLYAEFEVNLPDTQVHEVYLRIRNYKSMGVPIRLATAQVRALQKFEEIGWLGILMGILTACILLSVVLYAAHRSPADLGAAGFGLLVLMTIAVVNGVTNFTRLGEWPTVVDYAYSVLPMLVAGAMLRMLRLLRVKFPNPALHDQLIRLVGWLVVCCPLLNAIDRKFADTVSTALLMLSTTTGLVITFLGSRKRSLVWYLIVLAYVPLYGCLIRTTCESLGLLTTRWETRYLLSCSMTVAVPAFLYALTQATKDRKEKRVRARHLSSQDALTGLLTREAFECELEKAYDMVVDERQYVAVVLVDVANYSHIRGALGDAVAERCLLQAVIKLYRVARDVDAISRVAPNQFAMILEGVPNEKKLNERLVQLIAAGLTPLKGISPQVVLTFHSTCLLLHQNLIDPHELLPALERTAESVSIRGRRPIRYVKQKVSKRTKEDSSLFAFAETSLLEV